MFGRQGPRQLSVITRCQYEKGFRIAGFNCKYKLLLSELVAQNRQLEDAGVSF